MRQWITEKRIAQEEGKKEYKKFYESNRGAENQICQNILG